MATIRKVYAMPRMLRAMLIAVIAAGAASVATRLPELRSWTLRDVGALALLVAATAFGERLDVSVRFGKQTKHVTMTEAAFAAALVLGVRASVLTLAVAIGVTCVYAVRRVAPYKVAFNAGSYVAAVTVAEIVFTGVRPAGSMVAVAAAMVSFFAVNASTVVGVIALSEGRSFASVFAPIAHLEFGHTAVNLGVGILLANVWTMAPAALLVLLAAPALARAGYRMLLRRRSPVAAVAA